MKICTTCGDKVNILHSHHIVPVVLGGLNIKGNLVKLCGTCHSKIHDVNFLKADRLREVGIKKAKLKGTYTGRVKGGCRN